MGGLVMRKIIGLILVLIMLTISSCNEANKSKYYRDDYINTNHCTIKVLNDSTALVIPTTLEIARTTKPYIISTKCKEK